MGVPPQVGPLSSGDEAAAQHNGVVGVTAYGGGNVGIRYRGGGDIRPPPPEYYIPVHYDSSDTGAMSGVRAVTGNAGGTEVVGAGGYQHGGREDSGDSDKGGIG